MNVNWNNISKEEFTEKIILELKQVFDPEIPVDIYNLGLIYKIDISDEFDVTIDMTLTAPNCPVATILPGQVKNRIQNLPRVKSVTVNLIFDPPWSMDRLSEEAKLILNLD
jgi:FeS assembly SUF system protein